VGGIDVARKIGNREKLKQYKCKRCHRLTDPKDKFAYFYLAHMAKVAPVCKDCSGEMLREGLDPTKERIMRVEKESEIAKEYLEE
jgi:NAD-dependent SIR2 family protein deacetylase